MCVHKKIGGLVKNPLEDLGVRPSHIPGKGGKFLSCSGSFYKTV